MKQAHELASRIRPYLTGSLKLTITDNRAVMISVQRDPKRREYSVRLHHLFVDAPTPILHALARYISINDRLASRELNIFIDQRQELIRSNVSQPAPPIIRTKGRFYDLKALFEELNQRYFSGQVRSVITWGRHVSRGKARRSIKVGSYCVEHDLIRIHPGLDQRWIPLFYIQWVIYHEMLHAVHPIPVVNGRRRFHTIEFARDERRFERFAEATQWERRNVAALLCI
jgi:hypothetical protein